MIWLLSLYDLNDIVIGQSMMLVVAVTPTCRRLEGCIVAVTTQGSVLILVESYLLLL